MSRGASQGRPLSWDTWSWIWLKVAARAEGTAAVVVGAGGAVVVVVGATVVGGAVVDVARDATLCPPPSPARTAITASPAARRTTTRAMATRGAGTRIAGHGTGG
jgi:hypothetical protein